MLGIGGREPRVFYMSPLHCPSAYPADAILDIGGKIRDDRENRTEAVLSVQNMPESPESQENIHHGRLDDISVRRSVKKTDSTLAIFLWNLNSLYPRFRHHAWRSILCENVWPNRGGKMFETPTAHGQK